MLLAKHLEGKVVTNDYNLNKVAKLHNVGVINLNDLSNALKPLFLPGETLEVRIVKPGEEHGQGVGYLEDGTMVVIEGGRDHVGQHRRWRPSPACCRPARAGWFSADSSGPARPTANCDGGLIDPSGRCGSLRV